jgi:ribosomal protein S18 acetylase RimI-like enzyme
VKGKCVTIIAKMPPQDLDRLHELDRSEHVTVLYEMQDGVLVSREVDLHVPRWTSEETERRIRSLRPELAEGGVLLGALDGDRLAGVAVLGGKLRGENRDTLELAFLHVSAAYRRQGIATRLFQEAAALARAREARFLYVSATESGSALGFYFSQGCTLAPQVDPELYALEPKDIHLVLAL